MTFEEGDMFAWYNLAYLSSFEWLNWHYVFQFKSHWSFMSLGTWPFFLGPTLLTWAKYQDQSGS
jgi:hypothetical protein